MDARGRKLTIGRRVPGLDAIRFVSAVWVLLGHYHFPAPFKGLGNAFDPGAAVVVFFIISGFCVHFPQRETQSLEILPYFARRHVRIIGPALVVVAISLAGGLSLTQLTSGVLWTLLCEEIYYTLYPALLWLRRRWHWQRIAAVCVLPSVIAPALVSTRGTFRTGPATDWITWLPIWLLGCWLAEWFDRDHKAAWLASHRWILRGCVWLASVTVFALDNAGVFDRGYSLRLLAVVALVWLWAEIESALRFGAGPLEKLGRLTYSLYLTHITVRSVVQRIIGGPVEAHIWSWATSLLVAFAVAVAFHVAIENPAHRVARRFADWVRVRALSFRAD